MSTKTTTSTTTRNAFWRGNIVAGGGRHRHLTASGSRVLTSALLDQPEVASADDALHNYGRCVDALVEAAKEPSPVTPSAIAARFAAGEQVDPAEFREAAEQAHRKAQLVTIERGGVQEVGVELWSGRDQAFDISLPAGIQAVSASFADLIALLREAGITEADADAKAAIEAGRVDEHRRLTVDLDEYRDIRLAAAAILNDAGILPDPEGSQAFWLAALLAQPLDVDPWWPVRHHGLGARNKETGERVNPQTAVIPELGELDGLAWLASHADVEVHVASPAAYRATRKLMSAMKDAAITASTPDRVLVHESDGSWRARDVADPRAKGSNVWIVGRPANAFV